MRLRGAALAALPAPVSAKVDFMAMARELLAASGCARRERGLSLQAA